MRRPLTPWSSNSSPSTARSTGVSPTVSTLQRQMLPKDSATLETPVAVIRGFFPPVLEFSGSWLTESRLVEAVRHLFDHKAKVCVYNWVSSHSFDLGMLLTQSRARRKTLIG